MKYVIFLLSLIIFTCISRPVIVKADPVKNPISKSSLQVNGLQEKFNSLKAGMSYEQVRKILTKEGKLVSQNTIPVKPIINNKLFSWNFHGDIIISVMFENNSLITKGNKGLLL